MKHVVEIIAFKATDEYLADHSLAVAAGHHAKKFDAFLKGFRGFSVEDPTQAYHILVWKGFAGYEATTKREDYEAYQDKLKLTMKGTSVVIRHIEFDEETTTAFSAPVTEYSIVKPKEGTTQAEVDAVIASMKAAGPSVPGAHSPLAWGPIKDSEAYALVAGWDTVEAHMNALKAPPIDVFALKLFGIADLTVINAVLHPI